MQSDDYFKETDETYRRLTDALSDQTKAILDPITRWAGSTELAFLHIFDKRLFGSENKEIVKNAKALIMKLHKDRVSGAITFVSGDSVISFGFKLEIK